MPFSYFLELFSLENITGFIQDLISSNNELIMMIAAFSIGIYIIIMAYTGQMGELS